jgi:prepilin-type N-terminal cleavage/methylation domain-containing protein
MSGFSFYMKNKAFTLVEICIVIVIIGLLSAMIIPAFQLLRESSVVKMVERGEKLNPEQREIYKEHLKKKKGEVMAPVKVEREETTFNGVRYRVVKKEDMKEVTVNGQTVYLIED